jgi:alkylated DNA nucleotide flippase Atl1
MSIGYSAPSNTVRAELQDAYDHGVVVIASAGNSGGPGSTKHGRPAPESFPANYPGVISVSAVSASGTVANFSSDNLSVKVAAPGVRIPAQGRDGQYWLVSGTSPACALVAGVAALIKSKYPRLAPDLVATALTSTTTDRPAGGYDRQVGFGIVKRGRRADQGRAAGGCPAGGDQHQRHVRYHGVLPPAPVRPRGSGQLVLVLASGADLAGADRRRRDPAGRAPSRPGPGEPVTRPADDGGSPPVDDFASSVLDVVDSIPPGRVMSYGDIAEYLGSGPGPRQVGRVMATYGGAVAWWRVIHSDGTPAPGHDSVALRHYLAEGTPLRSARPRSASTCAAPAGPAAPPRPASMIPKGLLLPKPNAGQPHNPRRAVARARKATPVTPASQGAVFSVSLC